jgi:hypothetical protein
MPFEIGETEESLRAQGMSELDIELRHKYHTPDHHMSPENRAIVRANNADREQKVREGKIAKPPRKGDNFAIGLNDNLEPFPVKKPSHDAPAIPPDPAQALRAPDLARPQHRQDTNWDGRSLRTAYRDHEVARRNGIADAARDGQWHHVFRLLGSGADVNQARLGGREGFTPLHQAARHGAPLEVAQRLIDLGAWRTLWTYAGKTAQDIARERGHQHLVQILQPVILHPLADDIIRDLERQLHLLIRGRSAELVLKWQLQLPPLPPLTELVVPKLWFPVPGQYGGFSIELHGDELKVSSWNRVIGGWAQTHRITHDTIQLTEEGWDL